MKIYIFEVENDCDAQILKDMLDNKFRQLKFSLQWVSGNKKTFWFESESSPYQDLFDIGMAIKEYEIKQAKKKAINDAEIPLVLSAIERQIRMEEARISQRAIQIANQDKVLFNEPLQNVIPDYASQLKIALEILKQPA